MRILVSLSLCLVYAVSAIAQLNVVSTQVVIVEGLDQSYKLGAMTVVPAGTKVMVRPVTAVTAETDAQVVEMAVSDSARVPVEFDAITDRVLLLKKPGRFWVDVTAVDFKKSIYGRKTIVVDVGVVPPGPGPQPGPTPQPQPDPPVPDGEAPIAGDGLRVLFVVESADELPPAIQQVIYGPDVRAFLNANAVKVGDTPDWRIVDPDAKFTDGNHRFAKALARPRASLPWLIISNGRQGYEGPFPGGVAETLALIKSFLPVQADVKASVTMYTTGDCLWCDKWLAMELKPLKDAITIEVETVDDTSRKMKKWPTFVISKNGKSVTLGGYQTSATIIAEINKL